MVNMSADDYIAKAKEVTQILVQCIVDPKEEWKQIKDADGVQAYSKPSPDVNGNMYKVETIFNSPPAKVLAAVDPNKQYRIQWDDFLGELKVEAKLTENVSLIYHGTKAMLGGIVSARDSLDVVTVGQQDGYYFVAAGTVDHINYPPREHSVRIHQYTSGYVIFPVEGSPDKCRFVMAMNVDMKMNSVVNFMAEPVKPRLLLEKIKNLRRGLDTLNIVY